MRRADALEARCRELAVAAGLDPDAKIPREGMRPIPTWCTFRDAARAERNADQAAALGAMLSEQPEAYRDSPLTILGDHEASTVDQMRNCMKVGNVVAGVICADGHLGYAQPVGGVIAYDGQISGGGGIDKFRIKITRNGQTIFDNRMGVPEDPDVADPQAISGGSIVIHK